MTNATIIEKIRNLRAKAADAAASEAEAQQAADMAAKLLSKYDLDECDLQQTDGGNRGTIGGYQTHKNELHMALRNCAVAISNLTETECYKVGGKLNFVGTGADVEMALYLSEMIRGAADRAWTSYRKNKMYGARSIRDMHHKRKSFLFGFGQRLAERLNNLATERKRQRETSTGTDLVVVKDQIIKDTMADNGIVIRSPRRRGMRIDGNSQMAGRSAGDSVNLNRPVGGGGSSATQIA